MCSLYNFVVSLFNESVCFIFGYCFTEKDFNAVILKKISRKLCFVKGNSHSILNKVDNLPTELTLNFIGKFILVKVRSYEVRAMILLSEFNEDVSRVSNCSSILNSFKNGSIHKKGM